MGKVRILALDGGGIRGALTATLLDRLQARFGGFLPGVDVFAGTSTGGILALGLAAGLSPGRLAKLYVQHGSEIFDDSFADDLRDLGNLTGADYDSTNLKKLLVATFGKKTLGDLGRRVLVPAFDLDNGAKSKAKRQWKPKFFHNFPGSDSDAAERVVDVALRTSAAPTYFPSYQGYVDGGVVANNPSMAALCQVLDERNASPARLEDIVLLSLGTGTSLQYVAGEELDWGLAQWAKPLVTLMLDGSVGVADYQCRKLLGERYARLAPVFPPGVNIPLDGAEKVEDLVELANEVDIAEVMAWLGANWV